MEGNIAKVIADATGVGVTEIQLETPDNDVFGDFTTNVALQLKGKEPLQVAHEIVNKLRSNKKLQNIVEKVEVAGPGFINFWLKKDVLINNLTQIDSQKENYGKSDLNKRRKVMVEFAHPNTHKAFHIGHLRNISVGESIVRLLEAIGHQVIRANYQGDVGMHIAKALWGIKKVGFNDPTEVKNRVEFLGRAYAEGSRAYDQDDNAKSEIHSINKKIYSKSDPEINELYQKTRQWSLDYFETIYKRVYTKFHRLYFESECQEDGKNYAYEGLKKGILKKSDGAIIFPGSEYGLHDRVFITKEGVPTYEAKDLGLIKLQLEEFNTDQVVHVVGPEQTEYFKVVFKVQELLFPETKGTQLHVPYGWVRLKEGKMSSRTGRVVLGESLLDEASSEIGKQFNSDEKIAEIVAVGAVKYSFLKVGREQEIAFDLKESISLEGNSGPYLQYTFARTQSVLQKANYSKMGKLINSLDINDEEIKLLRSFIRFPGMIINAAKNYSPNIVCNYLHDLAQKYNSFYSKERILGDEKEKFRLALTFATGQILKNGLNLLGIQAPERM